LALTYLNGNESPTAAKMNELWAEADTVIDKALDGKSTYVMPLIVYDDPEIELHVGKEFFFYTSGNHDDDDFSVLYSVLNRDRPLEPDIPANYNQATFDTAASGAVVTYVDATRGYALTSNVMGLDGSLKAHTTTIDGDVLYFWEPGQPAPEKHWKLAVAEIIIGDTVGGSFDFLDEWSKYNAFKIHNLTQNQITVRFGTHYTIVIPAWSQQCVRRDTVSSGYDSTYKYFFKTQSGDPRYLHFKYQTGFIAASMRANNITNASYLYSILEIVGQRDESTRYGYKSNNRITFDAHTYTDVGGEYATGGYVPTISDSTLVGDLIFHRGDLSYFRAVTTGSTPEFGSVTFNGFGGLTGALSDAGLSGSDAVDNYSISLAGGYEVFYLWQRSTNLLVWNETPRVLNLGSSGGSAASLATDIPSPLKSIGGDGFPMPTNGVGETAISSTENAATITVGEYIEEYQTAMTDIATTSGESIVLTTEGAILLSTEHWPIASVLTPTNPTTLFGGLSVSNHFDLELDDGARLKYNTDRSLSYRTNGTRSGWPSHHLKFHRMFEGPRQARVFELFSDVSTNDGMTEWSHRDIENDPVGASGADFTLNPIGALTLSTVAYQTCDIATAYTSVQLASFANRNYPWTIINDVSVELEKRRQISTSIADFVVAMSGDEKMYSRLNLLKEHYNDLVTEIKRCTKFRPLCIDEVVFGAERVTPINMNLFSHSIGPRDCYASFDEGSATETLYQNLGVTIRTKSDFPNDLDPYSDFPDQLDMESIRWVSIADVQSRAKTLGFKFRYEQQFALLSYKVESYLGYKLPVETWFDAGTFRTVSGLGGWKIPISVPVLSGSDYIDSIGESLVKISNETAWLHTRMTSTTSNANRAISFYLIDTSRTETGALAKIATKQLAGGLGGDTLADIEDDETVITPPDSLGQYTYLCQTTPPVTHSA
jgi:hypothetical protein